MPEDLLPDDQMHVLYDPDSGAILAVMDVALPQDAGLWLAVPAMDLGDLSDWRVGAGVLVRVSLEGARVRAIARVNAAAGQVRRRYITEIPGQEMIYLQKEAEAVAFLANPAPDPARYPFIAAEVGATAPSAHEVAQVYVNLAALLRTAGATLEQLRLGAIVAIETTDTAAGIEAAVASFDAALAGLG